MKNLNKIQLTELTWIPKYNGSVSIKIEAIAANAPIASFPLTVAYAPPNGSQTQVGYFLAGPIPPPYFESKEL